MLTRRAWYQAPSEVKHSLSSQLGMQVAILIIGEATDVTPGHAVMQLIGLDRQRGQAHPGPPKLQDVAYKGSPSPESVNTIGKLRC